MRSASGARPKLGAILPLCAILLLCAGLRLVRLDHTGFVTPYYAAAVLSMSGSWHDFLFAAFDPAGFLAVDKPPVALWLQVMGVTLFGFGKWGLHLPQVALGVAGAALLFHLVARRFGTGAGLLASLFLALTPLAVAVDRSNNTDSCLVFVLLLAAWPLALATERASWRLLLLAAAVLGVGFNVKMLAAMVVAPAFVLLYWLGAPAGWQRRLAHLLAAGLVLAAVSLSWPLFCDLTPAEQRPYVDSTQENSVLELAIGHNAMDRFVRPAWRRGFVREPEQGGAFPTRATGGVPAGPFRLADPHLAAQVLWLLPLALAGLFAGGRVAGGLLPLAPERQALLLWGGWALVAAIVYSAAGGIFQPYYLAPLAPPLAALAGIALIRVRAGWGLIAALFATALWQAAILWGSLPPTLPIWLCLVPLVGVAIAGMALPAGRAAALAIGLVALLAAPGAWIGGTLASPERGGAPVAHLLPRPGPALQRGGAVFADDPRLLGFLAENRGAARYLLATASVRQAAPIILRTGAAVMAMGGFIGTMPILTPEDLSAFAASGELRFVMLDARRGGGANAASANALREWVEQNGREVPAAIWRSIDPPERPGGRRGGEAGGARLFDIAPR